MLEHCQPLFAAHLASACMVSAKRSATSVRGPTPVRVGHRRLKHPVFPVLPSPPGLTRRANPTERAADANLHSDVRVCCCPIATDVIYTLLDDGSDTQSHYAMA